VSDQLHLRGCEFFSQAATRCCGLRVSPLKFKIPWISGLFSCLAARKPYFFVFARRIHLRLTAPERPLRPVYCSNSHCAFPDLPSWFLASPKYINDFPLSDSVVGLGSPASRAQFQGALTHRKSESRFGLNGTRRSPRPSFAIRVL